MEAETILFSVRLLAIDRRVLGCGPSIGPFAAAIAELCHSPIVCRPPPTSPSVLAGRSDRAALAKGDPAAHSPNAMQHVRCTAGGLLGVESTGLGVPALLLMSPAIGGTGPAPRVGVTDCDRRVPGGFARGTGPAGRRRELECGRADVPAYVRTNKPPRESCPYLAVLSSAQ